MKLVQQLTRGLIVMLLIAYSATNAQTFYENREDIPENYKWNLNDIYTSWEDWEQGMKDLEAMMDKVTTYKGRLSEGPETLLEVQQLQDKLGILLYKVYRYPQLTRDLDTRNQDATGKLQQVQILLSKFNTATSWINPEMLQIPWETMEEWLDNNSELEPYRFGISDLYRQQAHVLDEDKEKLISYYTQFNSSPSDVYSSLSTADVDFPEVELSDDETLKATNGNYSKVLATNRVQDDRRKMFEAHYGVYKDQKHTYASIYSAVCQRDWANAQARNYSSSVEAALEGNNVPVAVYENLVNTVKANTAPLKKYYELRKRILGLEKYYSYDGSIPIVDFDKTYPYEEAQKWVLASVAPLGDDYVSKLETAMQGGWIDVYENTGKRSGAYSAGVYGVHPYMLMNYNETMDNMFTLGHELGHTLHTLLAYENQPFATADYTIFVAEVASTFNENLLLDYLYERMTDPKERIQLLQQQIRNITGTFYFQTLLADFELQAHRLAEQGKPITEEVLTNIMAELLDTYYGDAQEKDEFLAYVWARIPHIYRTPFYVYQYATCFASSAKLYNDISSLEGEAKEAAIKNYLNLLKSGGNDYPMEQLKKAGVDLSKPETIQEVIDQLEDLVNKLEVEIDKLG